MSEKAFLHGDRVIYFHSYGLNPPDHKVGWFLRHVNDGHGYNRLVVAEDPERLAKGYGVDVHPKYVHHYSTDLWDACERWGGRVAELDAQRQKLMAGKVPAALRQPALLE